MAVRHSRLLVSAIMPALGLLAVCSGSMAENIAVGNYGSSANGMPFAVALAKGYFQEEGANVTGIIASEGGGTSVRNAMAGVAYGEANPGAIAVAIQQGADIKIVSDNVLTIAEFAWMVKKDSPIKTIKDLKGKKIGYTNPRSTSALPRRSGRTTSIARIVLRRASRPATSGSTMRARTTSVCPSAATSSRAWAARSRSTSSLRARRSRTSA